MIKILITVIIILTQFSAKSCEFTIARLKYGGGGDWYANPSSLPNLAKAVAKNKKIDVCDSIATVSIMDETLFRFPFLYATGHGEIQFTPAERVRIRKFLAEGGFIWFDDNYGMDKSLRRELSTLFPSNPLVEIPDTHSVFKTPNKLGALPKIHEHDGEPARAFGIFLKNQIVIIYTYSSDIGDGMEDLEVHNDGVELHKKALEMGENIINLFFNADTDE